MRGKVKKLYYPSTVSDPCTTIFNETWPICGGYCHMDCGLYQFRRLSIEGLQHGEALLRLHVIPINVFFFNAVS